MESLFGNKIASIVVTLRIERRTCFVTAEIGWQKYLDFVLYLLSILVRLLAWLQFNLHLVIVNTPTGCTKLR